MNDIKQNPDPILDTKQAAEYLNLAPGTLHNWRSNGYGPSFLKLKSKIGYRLSALNDYLDSVTNRKQVENA
jgi:hypothetical protein